MRGTRVSRHVNAPRERVYRALIDPNAIVKWKVPDGMNCSVDLFEPWEGGSFRVSLTYSIPARVGKSSDHTDSYHGSFVELVPDERVVEIDEFETMDPALQGEMRITVTLSDKDGGTEVVGVHDGLPPGVSITDNETGWRMALEKLSALVEESPEQ